MKNTLNDFLTSFLSLFFPRTCIVCGNTLEHDEDYLCMQCLMDLPRTNYHLRSDNPIEQMFWGKIPVERATSYLYYRKGSDFRRILHLLKYGGCKELGEAMGRCMALELLPSGFFSGMDVIIPVPLHEKKKALRGYNQSEWIARGVAAVAKIPIDVTSVAREKNTDTQTRKSTFERWENVEGIFRLLDSDTFEGKHILLIDDVLTTGATILACASAFDEVRQIRISVLTLAVAVQ